MNDTFIIVVAIGLSAVLMFVFPLMTMADRTDDVAQLTLETAISEFVNEVRTTGKITPDRYNKFVEDITSTGNLYEIEMEVKILDENPGKKTTQGSVDKVGENVYYSVFKSDILENYIDKDKTYILKEGDIIVVTAKNINLTLAQQLANFFYTVAGNNTYTQIASDSGIVTATGNSNK